MLIKVCGMRNFKQVKEVELLADFVGFIFYQNSKRFVNKTPKLKFAEKVGVFVNPTFQEVQRHIAIHSLDVVQLHGQESPELCSFLREKVKVIKVFGVDKTFNFKSTTRYDSFVDFFLFDTKTPLYGGSGHQYDWSVLSNYLGDTPFFLSGGIRPSLVNTIRNFKHSKFKGIDLNSGFEHSPSDKDIDKLKKFIEQLTNHE